MEVKIAATVHQFHFRRSSRPSLLSMIDRKRRRSSQRLTNAPNLVYRSSLFGTSVTTLMGSSVDPTIGRKTPVRRACSAVSGNFWEDDESMKRLHELAFRFCYSDDNQNSSGGSVSDGEESNSPVLRMDPSQEMLFPSGEKTTEEAEMNRKGGGLSESAYCSVKKAFSSMVFMIRELQSYTLHMRQLLFYEDLRGVLANVHREIHASFVWLFQQVFSCTPTLMVYVMILLANFTVYSMAHNTALAASPALSPLPATSATVSVISDEQMIKSPDKIENRISFSTRNNAFSVGGGSGGGGVGKSPPVAGGTDGGEGRLEREFLFDSSFLINGNQPSSASKGIATREDEWSLWASMVEESNRMRETLPGDVLLDRETIRTLVAPVSAVIEADDPEMYLRTHLTYQNAIEHDPHNPLILSNYGQFLHLVVHDHDRAEEYFQRAARADPPDAEALNRYATFLWMIRKDISTAEERFLEAIAVDPTNTYYAGNYASFLWNTGGEDTCFPLEEEAWNSES